MVIMIDLPDGINPGSAESIKFFAREIARQKKKNPKKSFQLVPFSYSQMPGCNGSHLISLMATAD